MPIILISVDSVNKNLVEFENKKNVIVDVMMESTYPRSKEIGDEIASKMTIINRRVLDKLDDRSISESEEDAAIRLQAAINVIRKMNVQNAVIISHNSVFKSWNRVGIDEWDIIGM
jgi:hypothetical protein